VRSPMFAMEWGCGRSAVGSSLKVVLYSLIRFRNCRNSSVRDTSNSSFGVTTLIPFSSLILSVPDEIGETRIFGWLNTKV
jgi:hypothetical protein